MLQDLVTRRILSFCLGLSMILLSSSAFMYSIKPAKADTTANPTPWDDVLRGGVGLGIVKDTAYFVVFTSQGNKFYKAPTDKAVSWYED